MNSIIDIFYNLTYGFGDWLVGKPDNFVSLVLFVPIGIGVIFFPFTICYSKEHFSPQWSKPLMVGFSATLLIFFVPFGLVTVYPMHKAKKVLAQEKEKVQFFKKHIAPAL